MSQDLFNHSLLASSNDIFREFAKLVQSTARDHIINTVKEVAIYAIDRTQGEIDLLIREAPWRLLPFPGNGRIDDLATSDLIDAIEVVQIPEGVAHDLDSNITAAILTELTTRVDDKDIIITRLQQKLDRYNEVHPRDADVATLPKAVGCGIASGTGIEFIRKILTSASKSFIRSCFRSPQDGKRVSREKHEWDYVRGDSAQWQQMLDAVNVFADDSLGVLLDDLNIPSNDSEYTYGNFVDLALCRRAVAQIRKVRRLIRAANVKEILEITGQDPEQLTFQLVSQIDFQPALTELRQYFGSGE